MTYQLRKLKGDLTDLADLYEFKKLCGWRDRILEVKLINLRTEIAGLLKH